MEMFFYVVFASLALVSARARVWALTVFFGVLIAAGQLFTFEAAIPKFYASPIILGFVLGMWIARLCLATDRRLTRVVAKVLFAASVVSLLGIGWQSHLYFTHELLLVSWLTVTAAAQLAVAVFFIDRGGLRVPPWALAAGDASYSLYLFHMFAVALALLVVTYLLPGQLLLAMAVAAVAATSCGLVVYRYVEAPLIEWVKPAPRRKIALTAR
jgi:peptidoglycan/LPS O-acetylase OafA/YrhL